MSWNAAQSKQTRSIAEWLHGKDGAAWFCLSVFLSVINLAMLDRLEPSGILWRLRKVLERMRE
jgi:hypothetical protein